MTNKKRCAWCGDDPIYIAYHDKEWGKPVYDDKKLFEFLILEGMQAGLSWITILKKRDNYRKAFYNFDAAKINRYSNRQFDKLMQNPGIIRNRLKINAIINNARIYLDLIEQEGSFRDYIWQFTDGNIIKNRWKTMKQVPVSTKQSDVMAKDLKKRGFKFVGTTICYAYMQAVGMVNDHLTGCYRHAAV